MRNGQFLTHIQEKKPQKMSDSDRKSWKGEKMANDTKIIQIESDGH